MGHMSEKHDKMRQIRLYPESAKSLEKLRKRIKVRISRNVLANDLIQLGAQHHPYMKGAK